MPVIDLAETPQGELPSICIEAGLTKDRIEAVIRPRDHCMRVAREAGETRDLTEAPLPSARLPLAARSTRAGTDRGGDGGDGRGFQA